MVEFDLLTTPGTAYSDFRYTLFTKLFGENLRPYVDDEGRPRIGAAIDLTTSMSAAASEILGGYLTPRILVALQAAANQAYEADETELLQSRLDQVLDDFRSRSAPLPQVFKFNVASQAKSALETTLTSAEAEVSGWNSMGVPLSQERAVVMSLAQEGYDITDILNDLTTGQTRAEPWFEIRYHNQAASEATFGQAAERFYQSAVFELYNDPDNVGFAEAVEVGRAYTANRATALAYEETFDPEQIDIGDLPSDGQQSIATILQPAIAAVAAHYFAEVPHADELIFVPRSGDTFYGDAPKDAFNSAENDEDLIVGSAANDKIVSGAAGDVVLGLGGQDRLNGGTGDDRLYGGDGADVLIGGDGDDKLWGGGKGDVLEGGRGDDTYILGGDAEADADKGGNPADIGTKNTDRIVEGKRDGIDTVIAQVNSGDFNLRNAEEFRLDTAVSGNLTVNLNEFDRFTLSGGRDELTLVINRLQKTPISIETGDGADLIRISFEKGVDPSQVLNGKGLTARFEFTDLTNADTIDLTSIGINAIFTEHDQINDDVGFYLLAPGVKLDVMDGSRIEKTYNNYTDSWFVVKCGDDTPYGPEFLGDIDPGNFHI